MSESRKTICMCIDIRNSTNFHTNFKKMEDATKVIANFISDIYLSVKEINEKIAEKFIYAGDGIMFIYQLNTNEINNNTRTLKNFLETAEELENIIINYENDYENQNFKAGISLDYGDCIEHHVKYIPNEKGKTPLYVGFPVSRSTKICKTLPLSWKGKERHLGLSQDYYQELLKSEIDKDFKLTHSKKKAMKYG